MNNVFEEEPINLNLVINYDLKFNFFILKKQKVKFFLNKASNVEKKDDSLRPLLRTEMQKILGGIMEDRDPPAGRTYTESTYVRR
ncbi:hypothetical protein OD917_11680 [Flavobacterium sp. SH_e]|uniref:hypothetical protein n=1 Tax=Flavobacterium TaxID=237 RepID=UPI0021E4E0C6|nr:hypothetical protein [Flavobacterium sp. SH_e]MCV2485589.1 hypothetical protein [Flavobacterium sp. SH_e]